LLRVFWLDSMTPSIARFTAISHAASLGDNLGQHSHGRTYLAPLLVD
jgi:hypothetical protein